MKIKLGVVLQDRWKLVAKLSTGDYCKVFLARASDGSEYAVKVDESWWIADEKKIYDVLHDGLTNHPRGIPRVLGHGYEEDSGFLVLSRLGVSIQQLWSMCQRRFTHATIAKIAVQAIKRLEFIHSRGVVHGDIFTKNFVMGSRGDETTVYLIDYGNAKRFTNQVEDGNFEPNEACTGGSCPRDDLMALARMLVKLHRDGNHTWLKESQPVVITRRFMRFASCFGLGDKVVAARSGEILHYWEYMRYVDRLETTQMPDYHFLIGIFTKYLDRIGERDDKNFQWMDLRAYKDSFRV